MGSRIVGLVFALALLPSTGCTTIQRTKAMNVERTLATSGFQVKPARTPEQKTQVQALPQRKLARVRFEDGFRYVYGDAELCECIYVGTERAFARYRTAAAEQIEREELASSLVLSPPVDASTLERNETLASRAILDPSADASLAWETWGPWGPWY